MRARRPDVKTSAISNQQKIPVIAKQNESYYFPPSNLVAPRPLKFGTVPSTLGPINSTTSSPIKSSNPYAKNSPVYDSFMIQRPSSTIPNLVGDTQSVHSQPFVPSNSITQGFGQANILQASLVKPSGGNFNSFFHDEALNTSSSSLSIWSNPNSGNLNGYDNMYNNYHNSYSMKTHSDNDNGMSLSSYF